jgi:signal transduction histidine kinase
MEYDLISALSGLAASDKGLDEKLEEAAGLIKKLLGADQCCIYIWDSSAETFMLMGAAGEQQGRVYSYGPAEGLPGRVMAEGAVVEAMEGFASNKGVAVGVESGEEGFASAYAAPVTEDSRLRGVLCIKSLAPDPLTDERRGLLDVASSVLALILRTDALIGAENRAGEEIKDLKARLKSVEKYMALGDMAATLAHEIKNPLVSIGGFASRVKRKLRADSPAHKYADEMLREVKRLEKVTNGVIRVLKEDVLELRLDDVNDIIADAIALFDDDFRAHGIEVVKDFSASRLAVMADREQLKIAFDNLIANAIQSMDKGGTLRLSTELFGDWIVAEIEDSGGGIDPGDLSFVFNPFFTTKERGTGLGLPITHSIIMRHKGEIDVVNKRGVGVLFSLRLPRAPKQKVR